MSRRFGKHNIIGSEAGQPRPIAYMRQGAIGRRPRAQPRLLLVLSLAAAIAAAASGWWLG